MNCQAAQPLALRSVRSKPRIGDGSERVGCASVVLAGPPAHLPTPVPVLGKLDEALILKQNEREADTAMVNLKAKLEG